jgi:hypothetical protein
MELTKDAADKHEDAVKTLIRNLKTQLRDGDTLKVTYDFIVQYYGDIVRKLQAVGVICSDPSVVVTASCGELEEGRILVYEVLKKLDHVIQLARQRDEP